MSENKLINRRNAFVTAGVISAGVATQSHAVITADQVQAKYDSSGAEKTTDGAGLMVIGISVGVLIVGVVLKLIRR